MRFVLKLFSSKIFSPSAVYEKLHEIAWLAAVSRPYVDNIQDLSTKDIKIVWPQEYSLSETAKWADAILSALSLYATIQRTAVVQSDDAHISAFISINDSTLIPITFDFSDYPMLDTKLVAHNTPYFKLQLAKTIAIPDNVYPGGYLPNDPIIYNLLGHLRDRRLKTEPRFDVYGRFGKLYGFEQRSACIDTLAKCGHPMHGGFAFVRYSRFLDEASSSRICIDLPGNGALCFRFIDMLALGCFIIAYPHNTVMPSPLINGEHLVYMKEDMSDLPELVEYYLHHEEERLRIAANAQRYFDNTLSKASLGAYYLRTIIEAVEQQSQLSL